MSVDDAYCSVRISAYSKSGFGDDVVEIIGPPEIYENGGMKTTAPPTVYDKTAKLLGTFLVTGPIAFRFPTILKGGQPALDQYFRGLREFGCEVKKEA
jgi:hypothetical protein